MKRIITVIAAVILLAAAVSASASSPAGTADNPLITLSYLNGAFSASMKSGISGTFGEIAGRADGRLDKLESEAAIRSFAPRFTQIKVLPGDKVKLAFGGSLTILTGSAALTASDGAVINVSAGNDTAVGTPLLRNQRYFCAEGSAEFTVSSAADAAVDGSYTTLISELNLPHPVFNDVIRRSWYYAAVDFVYAAGLFGGTGNNMFSPSVPMTRSMFVTVLHRLEGTPAASPGQFADVQNAAAYYYNAVAWASGSGIAGGYEDGTFRPDSPITREQMAAMMHRYAAYKQRDTSAGGELFSAFPDSDEVSAYASDAMKWAVAHGVINGSNGYLHPKDTATRAQVAQIILNYTEKIGG